MLGQVCTLDLVEGTCLAASVFMADYDTICSYFAWRRSLLDIGFTHVCQEMQGGETAAYLSWSDEVV